MMTFLRVAKRAIGHSLSLRDGNATLRDIERGRKQIAALWIVVVLLCSGCAVVETKVTRFHRLPLKGTGQTFAISPPRGGQIELSIYSARIAAGLEKYGWRQAGAKTADYLVGYEYGVSGPRETHGSLPLMGQTGGGTTFHTGTFTTSGAGGTQFGSVSGTSYAPPTYGIVGSVPISQTYYERWLLIIAKDRKKNDLFEIRCESKGTLSEISRVLHHIIDAAFTDFPGVSGETKTYRCVRDN